MRKYNYCVSRVMKNKSVSLYLLATSGFQVFMDEIHGVAIIIHICFSFLSAHIVHFILNLLFFVIISASMVIYIQTYCAKDFQDNLAKSPVKAKSREDLCMWLCGQHNLVNEKLGKDLFKCDMKTLDQRWRKSSDPNCQT